jgi:hypothetical protein
VIAEGNILVYISVQRSLILKTNGPDNSWVQLSTTEEQPSYKRSVRSQRKNYTVCLFLFWIRKFKTEMHHSDWLLRKDSQKYTRGLAVTYFSFRLKFKYTRHDFRGHSFVFILLRRCSTPNSNRRNTAMKPAKRVSRNVKLYKDLKLSQKGGNEDICLLGYRVT